MATACPLTAGWPRCCLLRGRRGLATRCLPAGCYLGRQSHAPSAVEAGIRAPSAAAGDTGAAAPSTRGGRVLGGEAGAGVGESPAGEGGRCRRPREQRQGLAVGRPPTQVVRRLVSSPASSPGCPKRRWARPPRAAPLGPQPRRPRCLSRPQQCLLTRPTPRRAARPTPRLWSRCWIRPPPPCTASQSRR